MPFPWPIYAMDTSFSHPLGRYPFETRCQMLRDIGYDATYLTLWSEQSWRDLPKLGGVKETYGLEVWAVYLVLDVSLDADAPASRQALAMLDHLEGTRRVELAVKFANSAFAPSDPAGDPTAIAHLRRLLEAAERRGITLVLYPHINHWLERMEDAYRLCRAIDHPLLRAAFCAFHWYAVDGKNLPERLGELAPFLDVANLCGSRRISTGLVGKATIEPLDSGELDNFAILGLLREVGFSGMIGLQGYSVGGDAYAKLARSLAAYRDMLRRLNAHPDWAKIQWA